MVAEKGEAAVGIADPSSGETCRGFGAQLERPPIAAKQIRRGTQLTIIGNADRPAVVTDVTDERIVRVREHQRRGDAMMNGVTRAANDYLRIDEQVAVADVVIESGGDITKIERARVAQRQGAGDGAETGLGGAAGTDNTIQRQVTDRSKRRVDSIVATASEAEISGTGQTSGTEAALQDQRASRQAVGRGNTEDRHE